MSDADIQQLLTWEERAEEFIGRYGLKCQQERFADARWIINGSRVSEKRLKKIKDH